MSYLHHRQLLAIEPLAGEAVADPGLASPLALLAEVLRLWAWSGLVALLLFEPLRGSDPLLGWLPFWLLGWPLCSRWLLWFHLHAVGTEAQRQRAPR